MPVFLQPVFPLSIYPVFTTTTSHTVPCSPSYTRAHWGLLPLPAVTSSIPFILNMEKNHFLEKFLLHYPIPSCSCAGLKASLESSCLSLFILTLLNDFFLFIFLKKKKRQLFLHLKNLIKMAKKIFFLYCFFKLAFLSLFVKWKI